MIGRKIIDLFLWPNKFLFQDGPLRIEASSTGSNTMISKIVRMVGIPFSVMACWCQMLYNVNDMIMFFSSFFSELRMQFHASLIVSFIGKCDAEHIV